MILPVPFILVITACLKCNCRSWWKKREEKTRNRWQTHCPKTLYKSFQKKTILWTSTSNNSPLYSRKRLYLYSLGLMENPNKSNSWWISNYKSIPFWMEFIDLSVLLVIQQSKLLFIIYVSWAKKRMCADSNLIKSSFMNSLRHIHHFIHILCSWINLYKSLMLLLVLDIEKAHWWQKKSLL